MARRASRSVSTEALYAVKVPNFRVRQLTERQRARRRRVGHMVLELAELALIVFISFHLATFALRYFGF